MAVLVVVLIFMVDLDMVAALAMVVVLICLVDLVVVLAMVVDLVEDFMVVIHSCMESPTYPKITILRRRLKYLQNRKP